MKLSIICTLLCASHSWGYSQIPSLPAPPSIGEALEAGKNVAVSDFDTMASIGSIIPDLILEPATVLQMSIEALAGLPLQLAFDAIKKMCSFAIAGQSGNHRHTPDVNKMSLILITSDERNVSIPLTEPERLWTNPSFNRANPMVLFITGWLTNMAHGRDEAIDTVFKAYEARGNYNFVVLDSARFIDTLYSWSAYNTEEIGKYVGNALAKLTINYPREKIHVIGHSLGAQIAGAAGRYYTINTGYQMPRITGLDPASPCFNEGETLTGIYRGDAEFVDIIHTDCGVLGQRQPVGDVDFFVNGVVAIQPGCVTIVCSHLRAWALWAETVYPGNEENFLAVRCNSIEALREKLCPGSKFPMGFSVPHYIKGNYFLGTESKSPYGKNANSSLQNVV